MPGDPDAGHHGQPESEVVQQDGRPIMRLGRLFHFRLM